MTPHKLLAYFLTFVAILLSGQKTLAQYYYFGTNEFVVYEGGTVSGTVYRSSGTAVFDLCVLVNTNVGGITPLQTSEMNGLVTSGACYQPFYNIALAHFNSGASSATFSFGINQNSTVNLERAAQLVVGDYVNPGSATVLWGQIAPNSSYVQQAWLFVGDNDSPATPSRYTSAMPEGSVNYFFFERSTNCIREPMTIRFTLSGSATLNTDYTISVPSPFTIVTGATNQITIPPWYTYGQVNVTLTRDSLVETDETITARIEPNSTQYTMPGTPTSTITIWDDTPAVSVSLLNQNAKEGADPIGFRVARSYYYAGGNSLAVNLAIGGTAVSGTDYSPAIPTIVTIPSGEYVVTNWITPLNDAIVEGVETVSATVLPGNYYVVDAADSNVVANIKDDYSVISVQATDDYAAETGNTGTFTVTRKGNYFVPITVQLNITGTATPGADYVALPTSVTLGAGVTSTNLTVIPLTNGGTEPAETVVLNLTSNASYVLGQNSTAVVTITGEGPVARDANPKAERYTRGSGTNFNFHSMVIPLEGLKGTRRDDVEFSGYTTAYHYNATNTASQSYATNRIPFNTPIASFGSEWGSPLYLGQTYSFGLYVGVPVSSPIIIYAFRRSDGGLDGTVELTSPDVYNATNWINFTTNGFARTVSGYGLTTILRTTDGMDWGTGVTSSALTHTADAAATNYVYLVTSGGAFNGSFIALTDANQPTYGYFYELTFDPRPGWRSVFVDQPHFQTDPLPPSFWNKTPDELLNYGNLVTNTVSLLPTACTNLDQSPELRRHPTLDQFVADFNNDPLALANYVQNEIELTDPVAYRDDGAVATESVNAGGVNRGAMGVYMEGQGSPIEQCALLVYLLRQAGYPATYVFPPEGGLKMLDTRLSPLLRMRISGAHDDAGRIYTTNRLIAVNYPWVATYISNQWVHLFPWIKDTAVEEGLDIYDYLPDPYKQTRLWVRDYILGKTNLMTFATPTDDTPATIFPRWLDNALKQNSPGVSLDDIGMRYINRRHLYAQWADFPRPTWTTNTSTAIESLTASGITNVSPTLTNIFDTVQVELYSVNNPQKKIATAEMRMADLHNRKFYLSHTNIGSGQVQALLTLGAYRPNATGQGTFSASDLTQTNKQVLTLTLDGTDDDLKLRLRHRRQNALKWETALDPDRSFFEINAARVVLQERPLRVGDLAAICFDAGRVTPAMLRVHAQELWNMEQMLSTNSVATNQVSAEVYQGSLTYLMGMSYYERTGRFTEKLNRWFKVKNLSVFQMGLAKISPRRNSNGTLYSGNLDPIWPNIDMFSRETAVVGNGTVRMDLSWDNETANQSCLQFDIVNSSAEEHATLNSFYGQSNSVSTVKLLQLAQSKVPAGGSNVVEFNIYNVIAAGNTIYNGKALKDHDPAMWDQVVNEFIVGPQQFVVGWMPPGIQTTPSGSFSGMAALTLGTDRYGAFIGNNQYGGYGDALPYNSVSAGNTPWMDINTDSEGNYHADFQQPVANQRKPGRETVNVFELLQDYAQYNDLSKVANPNQSLLGILQGLIASGAPNSYQNALAGVADTGVLGTKTDYRDGNGLIGQVGDPVNALTGEFYIDEVDMSLPGPMPLQVRRNYGSQNLAPNQLGYSWKLNYMPYLSVTVSNIIYVAEADGSVLAFDLISPNLWSPTLALNPTLNNNSTDGIGSLANRLNTKLTKVSTNYFLTGGDGSLRVFQEMSFPLTNSTAWDRLRPYLTSWQDNRSNFYCFEYGTNATQADYGQVRRVVSGSGNILRFEYDTYGRIVDVFSMDGRRVKYDYDLHGDLVRVIRPDTSEINYEYQLATWSTNSVTNIYSAHLLTKELKPDGRVLKNEYDDLRRVTNQWSTVGPDLRLVRNATFRYTNNFALTNITGTLSGTTTILDYTNNPTTYFYTNGLIRRIRDPLTAELVQDWYEANETNAPAYPRSLKTLTDKRGLVTTFLYDTQGNITNTTSRGDLLGDGNTNTTTTTRALYDANNLPTRTISPSGVTNLFFYTNTWLLARLETWPSNSTPTQAITNLYSYSNATNAADGTASYGLRVQEIRAAYSPNAATNEWAYSSRGFPTRQTRYTATGDPAVIVTNLYNYRGEIAQQTDAAGRMTRLGYDPLGRPQSRMVFPSPGGEGQGEGVPMAWDFSYYNENGEVTWTDGSRFNPEDYIWRDYDGAGRKTQEIHWRSRAKSDGTGVEAETGDNLYATTFQEFDAFNNLTKVTDPIGNYSLKRYDAIGQLTREEFYDASNVLLSTNGFRYNAAGDVTNAFNALGGLTEKQYTSTGKPKFQRNADGSTNGWLYYADGRLRREIQNNGAYWQTTYNDAGRQATKVFYSAAGTPLATNISELDRRGNLVKRTDAGGNVFTNLFDGLDRIKISAGPPIVIVTEVCTVPFCGNYVTNILQQKTTTFYDAAGVVTTNVNALGEKTIATSDALGRPTSVVIRDTNNVVVRNTTTAYAANQHSVTVTNGSGASAIVSTTFTDTFGNRLLSIGYPYANVREFTRNAFDRVGNKIFTGRYAATNASSPASYSVAFSEYDGLQRLTRVTDRDNALTTFAYNAAGNATNRTMPGGLQWQARYNNAGQMLQEKNVGSGGAATRTNTYAYYPAGSSFAGLLATNIDGRGVTCTHTYDSWLRPDADTYDGNLPEHDFAITREYDVRGFLTGIAETSTGYSFGNVSVTWTFDNYGQMASESVGNFGIIYNATQGWNAAGRRTALNLNGQQYLFGTRADGLLASVATPAGGGSYGYNSAGVLTNRNVGARSSAITSLDGVGRPLSITTKVSLLTKLTETLSWTGDGLLNTHTLDRVSDFTDSRAYSYANSTRRLTEERLNLDGSKRWTNSFAYDNGVVSGPGALTKIGTTSGAARWTGGMDAFSRINTETNVNIRRPASGKVNGPATITTSLDGIPQPVAVYSVNDSVWTNRWNSTLEISPGAHQLFVSAKHPSGQFTTNASIWFTNSGVGERVTDTFDGAGYVTQRLWKSPGGTTNRTQNLSWDMRGRLVKVMERDANANGYDWAAIYDPLGRRIQTRTFTVTNGSVIIDSAKTVMPFFDPSAEFLELGAWVDYQQTIWKLYGPDLNGRYGGLNGTGGFEAVAQGLTGLNPTVSDARGNILGAVTNGIAVSWTPARPTGYGAVPGYKPLPLSFGGDMVTASSWRGRPVDITGFVNLGARHYIPDSGSFLGSDPSPNDRDPNYYSFCGGDPINYFDADGRYGKNYNYGSSANGIPSDLTFYGDRLNNILIEAGIASAFSDLRRTRSFSEKFMDQAVYGDYATEDNGFAGILGQTGAGLFPPSAIPSDIRDTSAAFNNVRNNGLGWRTGGGAVLATVGWVPGAGDAIKGLLKPLFRTADDVPVSLVTPPHTPHTPPSNPVPPNHLTGDGYGVNDPAVRIEGNWSINDMKQGLLGHPPRGLGSPDLHHAGQMPGSGIHEILPEFHRGNSALHPNPFNQGVTDLMREQDRQLHWWYRAREQGADKTLPGWIYDK